MTNYDYFQFFFMIVFLVTFVGRTIYLMFKGVRPFVIGAGDKNGLNTFIELFFVVGLIIWILEVITLSLKINVHVFPDMIYQNLFNNVYFQIAGIVIILIGYFFFVLALISFGKSWRIGIDTKSPGDLVTSGIFSVSRNPIFTFIDLYFLGTWFIYSNLFFLIVLIIALIGIHLQILNEERFLIKHYGKTYEEYKQKVPRYFLTQLF